MVTPTLRSIARATALVAALLLLVGCDDKGEGAAAVADLTLREKIAQKIMLDVRFYCVGETVAGGARDGMGRGKNCTRPVTELAPALAEMITRNSPGGVILFGDNLVETAQIVRLNHALQGAALASGSGWPLLLAVDQEGGRVNRLPREESASFAGNMAIGATYPEHGVAFARSSAAAMSEQLRALGFNTNFAPTVDVNSNPDNPVINVRSYAESPQVVAELGAASVRAFQQGGLAATLKHFPGHGDTSVDSHTGLPRVERTLAQARATDLLPFRQVIDAAAPALTMTAHIQYPALDDTTLVSRHGEEIVVPATLSRKILTGILRGEFGYRGVIVTDSLHMAGISDYFTQEEAVVRSFAAGADIALMPIKVRFPTDLYQLDRLIDGVVAAVGRGELSERDIDASVARIAELKRRYVDRDWVLGAVPEKVVAARQVMASPAHRRVARELAQAALSAIYPVSPGVLPAIDSSVDSIQVIAPTEHVGEAFRLALESVSAARVEILAPQVAASSMAGGGADLVIVASIMPGESAVERGGMEDLPALRRVTLSPERLYGEYRRVLETARANGSKTVFVSMRSPYEAARFRALADLHIASFNYKAFIDRDNRLHGPVYEALAQALTRKAPPGGRLPVTVQAGLAPIAPPGS
ncbi:glycoside hydrolase family 3 protein [Microbulbifer yueqingensis]|uniref:beta-N-acetylhexosaminidase n=1 Tax=Microbulbifer yueqingensis TaxID=658219 RepID=A0A1G9APS9_9GAMM|nr:glycoside hydrolase family 3 protein [Microbulbifer yueqingensis]SDK28804.1 beta-N-acetylhexosaminidase [Microbulbifer yueqingensis]